MPIDNVKIWTTLALAYITAMSVSCTADKPLVVKSPATQSAKPLRLTDMTIRSEKDNRGPWSIYAKVVETVPGTVVGLSWRVESYTLANGSMQEGNGKWRYGDSAELPYAKSSLRVTGFRAEVPRHPRHPYAGAKLRLRAAMAERIEILTIPNFQINKELKVSGHGYAVTVRGKEGLALGRDPATLIESDLQVPPDLEKIREAGVFVPPCRFGFLKKDGTLRTANGSSSGDGLVYLGRNWAGRTLGFEVPVGIRLIETTVDVEFPWRQATPRNR